MGAFYEKVSVQSIKQLIIYFIVFRRGAKISFKIQMYIN